MTLREEAEKIAHESTEQEFPASLVEPIVIAKVQAAALSAVLAGMRMVLQGTPHLRVESRLGINQAVGTPKHYHPADYVVCARLGGACRVREVD